MRTRKAVLRTVAVAGALAALLMIPASASADGTVGVSLSEFNVAPDVGTVEAGEVTFNVENTGNFPHNFYVIRTDLAADALPIVAEGEADLSGLDVVASIEMPFDAGAMETLTANLTAGSYVLICNVKFPDFDGHYGSGMSVSFQVTGDPGAPVVGNAGLAIDGDGGLSASLLAALIAAAVIGIVAIVAAGRVTYVYTRS